MNAFLNVSSVQVILRLSYLTTGPLTAITWLLVVWIHCSPLLHRGMVNKTFSSTNLAGRG